MLKYETEKPARYPRSYPSADGNSRSSPSASVDSRYSRRALPLPPRNQVICTRTYSSKTSVPLKVWVVAGASCFAVCAALVLATVVITKWGYDQRFYQEGDQIYSEPQKIYTKENKKSNEATSQNFDQGNAIDHNQYPNGEMDMDTIEKLSIFKNIVTNREKTKNELKTKEIDTLLHRPQIHPHEEESNHPQRYIEKKDKPKTNDLTQKNAIPNFKPTLPDVFLSNYDLKLPDGFISKYGLDYNPDYYNDENLYEDYIESNSMTSYLMEKVQELYAWINSDPDFQEVANSSRLKKAPQFNQVLQALNASLIEGNVTIIMNKLKDIYFGDNYTNANATKRVIVQNSTDLLSFGILSLDVMLLHNIQLMAWENQETAKLKMMKDPDVVAFNSLFLDPAKVEHKQTDSQNHYEKTAGNGKRQNHHMADEDFDIGNSILENVLDLGLSTARAAIHLGRAYKSTKIMLNQITNRESLSSTIQNQLARNIDGNTHALNHMQMSYNKTDTSFDVNDNDTISFTELDCIWLLYCKNLVVTAKLNAPFGTMARINGVALRMLTGELSSDKALDTLVYEALAGWTELKCADMFPRCSKVNPAAVVMESILQPLKKSQQNSLKSSTKA